MRDGLAWTIIGVVKMERCHFLEQMLRDNRVIFSGFDGQGERSETKNIKDNS